MDINKAKVVLNKAFKASKDYIPTQISNELSQKIDGIIQGTHLTYRYIFITALLAKCTDLEINMLALQKGADVQGAYDARSLCHKVIVPFDKSRLEGRIGNSNEPFLNKPARFPTLSLSNPVRKGSDKKTLESVINTLVELSNKPLEIIQEALIFSLARIQLRNSKKIKSHALYQFKTTRLQLETYLYEFISKSFGGQSAVVVTGTLLTFIFKSSSIRVHPANQSGASKNGVGDIDIIIDKNNVYAVEVKDKIYFKSDVLHSLENVINSGFSKLLFIEGAHAKTSINKCSLIEYAEALNFELTFIRLEEMIKFITSLTGHLERSYLLNTISNILIEMRAKDELINHHNELLGLLDK